jgi:hypothetical protein
VPDTKIQSFGPAAKPWIIPEEDLARQAVDSLRGYIYQLHQAAAAWIVLKDNDILHLEVAEDYSQIIREPDKLDAILKATQVKDTRESGAVTLNSPDVISAIEALFRLQAENPGRRVQLVFLTTSEIGKERKNPLPSGKAGLVAWQVAVDGGNVAEIREALLDRLSRGELNSFVQQSSDETLREALLAPMTFACGASTWQATEDNNRNKLMELRDEVQSTADMAHRSYDSVLGYVITTILASPTRMLDRAQLIACLQRATAIDIPSQLATLLLGSSAIASTERPPELAELTALAQALLEVGSPPSMVPLFPDAGPAAQTALSAAAAVERMAALRSTPDDQTKAAIFDLAGMPDSKHLVVGPAGSGKSHTLWHTASRLLREGSLIPLFLPAAQLNTWNELRSPVADEGLIRRCYPSGPTNLRLYRWLVRVCRR